MSTNKELSPRIIKEMVRDNIIKPEEIRKDPAQVKRLVDHASPLRIKQLLQRRVLRREDFSDTQIKALFDRIDSDKDIAYIQATGLVKSRQEIPKSIRDRVHGDKNPKDEEVKKAVGPVPRPARSESEFTPSELISKIFLSKEEQHLKALQRDVLDPKNFEPGSGFPRVLSETVAMSVEWPIQEREALIDLAETYFRKHGSKKRQREYRQLIRSAREAIETRRSQGTET